MALTLNTNVSALIAQKNMNSTQDKLAQTLNRLSSGLRVNNAKDDAAGLAIAEGMSARIRALRQGERNGNDGISLIQTAESGMNQILDLMQRMRELASQASSGTYGASDVANLNTEFSALLSEINRITNTSDFNSIQLLDGTTPTVDIQIGSQNTADDTVTITLTATDATTLAIDTLDLTADAGAALDALDTAIGTVTTGLAQLGADHSNLEAAVRSNVDRYTRLESARSQIMDTDYAAESSNLAQYQVMQQAGAAMLSQANASGQIVLSLLQ
ncbi:flagellin FliC [Legionella israelensis]|uniref:flagellin N-terminal helical domain-containing protein n=1 Tax=Legionella israelensis TaxID=454 RepID=UPI0011800FDA|nr:flagellin [Legionella israelensis]QDP73456.1 flagellin FliC [Legionella israelensis]